MRYFFDIHLHGETDLDDRGHEFRSLKKARAYVIASGRVCFAESTPRDRAMLHQCVIEITNPDGVSDLVPLADCLHRGRNSQHLLLQAA